MSLVNKSPPSDYCLATVVFYLDSLPHHLLIIVHGPFLSLLHLNLLAFLRSIVGESQSLPAPLIQVRGSLGVGEGVPEGGETVVLGEGAQQSLPLRALVEGLTPGEGRARPVVVQLHRVQPSDQLEGERCVLL